MFYVKPIDAEVIGNRISNPLTGMHIFASSYLIIFQFQD